MLPPVVHRSRDPRIQTRVRADAETRKKFRIVCLNENTTMESAIGDYMKRSVARGRLLG